LLDLLASPEDGYPVIHVAGTNGKTSVTRMAAQLLSGHGLTPGLFTSPHLHRVEERFENGLHQMTPEQFAAAVAELAPIVDLFEERSGEGVTYFELTTALAYAWFAESASDVAVIETGLGGRLDATNAVDSDVAVVTTIGLEHTAYLGDTIAEIASEKLAILNAGATLVTGVLPAEADAIAAAAAAEFGAVWLSLGRDFEIADARSLDGRWAFDLRSVYDEYTDIELRLRGRHQVDNFATAVASVEALFGRALDEAGVREAAATASIPGRMEVLRHDPILMVDGAHNPQAMAVLAEALRHEMPGMKWEMVFGTMADKESGEMLESLRGLITRVHAVSARTTRARSAVEVAQLAAQVLDVPVDTHVSTEAALDAIATTDHPVLVTGSIYVVGEARAHLTQ
jgi:dihydrofolate synthase / folylpolyglutamate synthase